MSDTPRTDAAISDARNRFVYDDISDWAIDLAKELERENIALGAEVKVTRQNYEEYKSDNVALRRRLVELTSELTAMKVTEQKEAK